MKRFTETQKWEDPWFRRLNPSAKLLWQWLCDNCDHAGVITADLELASFQIGENVDEATLSKLGDRIVMINSEKIAIPKFIQFQYGKLSRLCKPHHPVFVALEKHGLDPDSISQNDSYKNVVDDYIRDKVISRDGFFCVYSGKEIDEKTIVIDHIIPRSKGGGVTMDNLVVASQRMNVLKSDMSAHRFCIAHSLDIDVVFKRLSKATGKPSESFLDNSLGYLGSLKEKNKEKDKEENKEKDKEEGENSDEKAKGTRAEFVEFATLNGLPESDGEFLHDHFLESGWKRGKEPIKNWKAAFRKWKSARWLPSQKNQPAKTHRKNEYPQETLQLPD